MKTLFITGTDTDAGKTLFARALVAKLVTANKRVAVFKPLAAGAEFDAEFGQVVNDDARLLLQQANTQQRYEQVNPFCFEPAIAPHIAAEEQGMSVSKQQLLAKTSQVTGTPCDVLVVEGAGGWLVPINQEETLADFAESLQGEVILVVGMKLGCINHAMLTVEQIKRSGLVITGWVANTVGPQMARYEANLAYLKSHIPAPLLAEIPYLPETGDRSAAEEVSCAGRVAAYIDLEALAL